MTCSGATERAAKGDDAEADEVPTQHRVGTAVGQHGEALGDEPLRRTQGVDRVRREGAWVGGHLQLHQQRARGRTTEAGEAYGLAGVDRTGGVGQQVRAGRDVVEHIAAVALGMAEPVEVDPPEGNGDELGRRGEQGGTHDVEGAELPGPDEESAGQRQGTHLPGVEGRTGAGLPGTAAPVSTGTAGADVGGVIWDSPRGHDPDRVLRVADGGRACGPVSLSARVRRLPGLDSCTLRRRPAPTRADLAVEQAGSRRGTTRDGGVSLTPD